MINHYTGGIRNVRNSDDQYRRDQKIQTNGSENSNRQLRNTEGSENSMIINTEELRIKLMHEAGSEILIITQ
jgi:hypothetical protein